MDHLLIQGPPRSGKTTLVQFILDRIDKNVSGFYTQEVRNTEGMRIGFDVIDIKTGENIPLARKSWTYNQTVGSYSVDVHAFANYIENLQLSTPIVAIDEIGKMELLYNDFATWLVDVIDNYKVICTIPQRLPNNIQEIIDSHEWYVIQIRSNTRDAATRDVLNWLQSLE